MVEVNRGGYKVKNASYWRRQCRKLNEDKALLREALENVLITENYSNIEMYASKALDATKPKAG